MSTPVIERTTIQMPALEQQEDWYVDHDLFPYEDSNDPNRRTHIINPPMNLHIWRPGMESQDIVDLARFNPIEITALCGYKFVPKHNPEKFAACDACMQIAQQLMSEAGE